jgi:hypothetical protein
MTAFSRAWSSSLSPTKRKGCSVQERGLSISAAPSTIPDPVRNINFALHPASTGRARESNPPVRETTLNLPGMRRPSLSRRTAVVGSAKCARVARGGRDGGREFTPSVSEVSSHKGRLRKSLPALGYRLRSGWCGVPDLYVVSRGINNTLANLVPESPGLTSSRSSRSPRPGTCRTTRAGGRRSLPAWRPSRCLEIPRPRR